MAKQGIGVKAVLLNVKSQRLVGKRSPRKNQKVAVHRREKDKEALRMTMRI